MVMEKENVNAPVPRNRSLFTAANAVSRLDRALF